MGQKALETYLLSTQPTFTLRDPETECIWLRTFDLHHTRLCDCQAYVWIEDAGVQRLLGLVFHDISSYTKANVEYFFNRAKEESGREIRVLAVGRFFHRFVYPAPEIWLGGLKLADELLGLVTPERVHVQEHAYGDTLVLRVSDWFSTKTFIGGHRGTLLKHQLDLDTCTTLPYGGIELVFDYPAGFTVSFFKALFTGIYRKGELPCDFKRRFVCTGITPWIHNYEQAIDELQLDLDTEDA